MSKEWVSVGDWPYEVSEIGAVRRIGSCENLKQRSDRDGYNYLNMYAGNGLRKTVKAHCLVAAAFIGKRPEGLQINHKDGDKKNNHYSNLEYVTAKENIAHARTLPSWPEHPSVGDPTWSHGEKNGRAILNSNTVLEIRNLHKSGISYSKLGIKYGVDKSTVACVVKGKTWK